MKCGRLGLSYQKPLSYAATTPKALQLSSQAPKSQPDVYRQAAPSTTGKDGLLSIIISEISISWPPEGRNDSKFRGYLTFITMYEHKAKKEIPEFSIFFLF